MDIRLLGTAAGGVLLLSSLTMNVVQHQRGLKMDYCIGQAAKAALRPSGIETWTAQVRSQPEYSACREAIHRSLSGEIRQAEKRMADNERGLCSNISAHRRELEEQGMDKTAFPNCR